MVRADIGARRDEPVIVALALALARREYVEREEGKEKR
jgi:hypothetical protein